MHRIWLTQCHGRDLGVEAFAERGDHLVRALEDAKRRRQRPTRCVLERFARRERRLLADDARAFDLVAPSVTTQWRVSSWTVSVLSLTIVTVYRKNHLLPDGWDRSGEYRARICTRTPRVVASDVNIRKHHERFAC